MGPFNRFAPGDTISWFDDRGVTLKTEEDGQNVSNNGFVANNHHYFSE